MPSAWNPEQYERFRIERSQPFYDLLALVQPRAGMRAIDLGCGTGALTKELHAKLMARETIGYDTSETMLAKSAAFAGDGLRFERADIGRAVLGSDLDLVFSNAALQWVPDHPRLFERLVKSLAPGGQLAVQMPANYDHPSHIVAIEVSREAPFKEALGGYAHRAGILAVEAYAEMFHALGLKETCVRLQVYGHVLTEREEVLEWVKGTLLTDYQQRLSPDLFARFITVYRERLLNQLEDAKPYFYPFKRVLLWARKSVAS